MNVPGRVLSLASLLSLTHCSGVFDLGASETGLNAPNDSVVLATDSAECPARFATSASEAQPDGTACGEFAFGVDQVLLRRTSRHTEIETGSNGDAVVKYVDVFDEAGKLRSRTIDRWERGFLESTSTESRWLPAGVNLPGPDGFPATWKTTFAYDASGRRISAKFDRAIDGALEAEHTWSYYPSGRVHEHVRHGNETSLQEVGESSRWVLEVFNEAGQLTSRLDDTSTGEQHAYASGGLRVVSEQVALGVVTRRDEWTMLDASRPALHKRFETQAGHPEPIAPRLTLEEQFEYRNSQLKLHTVWELVNDIVHTIRYDYDENGRELLMIEADPSSHCTRASMYDGHGNALQVRTDCNENWFDETTSGWNASNQIVFAERRWTIDDKVRIARAEYTYNRCGGLIETVSKVDGRITSSHAVSYESRGLIAAETNGLLSKSPTVIYDYDAKDRLTSRNADHWTFDETGRLSERAYGVPKTLEEGLAPVARISYRYDCSIPH